MAGGTNCNLALAAGGRGRIPWSCEAEAAEAFCINHPTKMLDPSLFSLYAERMDYRQIITIEPGGRSGKLCIRGLRITVSDVLEYLASDLFDSELLADFPDLNDDDIRACLAFVADR